MDLVLDWWRFDRYDRTQADDGKNRRTIAAHDRGEASRIDPGIEFHRRRGDWSDDGVEFRIAGDR
jgi:hypothetical protein